MGTMDLRSQPPQDAQDGSPPVEETMSFDEFCRRHRGDGLPATSSARRVPGSPRPRGGFKGLLLTPIPLPRLPRPTAGPLRRLAAWLLRLVPGRVKRSKAARIARRHPGLSAWVVVFFGAWSAIAALQMVAPDFRWEPERYAKWLARRGTRAVKATLAEIGPGVSVPEVRTEPIEDSVLGYYRYRDSSVTLNAGLEYDDIMLLDVAAHECVHAIFHQHDLEAWGTVDLEYLILVNETAAYVLGAHIAGELWSELGHDGSLVTEELFQSYRRACDPVDPESVYARFLDPDREEPTDIDREEWHSLLVHFGAPLRLVDEVYEICHLNSDPVEACRKIADRFMRADLAPADRPILEEFERTKRQGARP